MAETPADELSIPIVEETATIAKRAVETDHVRIRTVVDETRRDVTVALAGEDIEVERRSVERAVEIAPEPYRDGELLIIPIVEERAVVETRLFVTEELVVRRVPRTTNVTVPTTVRTMRAVVERDEPTQ